MQIYFAIVLTIAALVAWGMGVRAGASAPRSKILLYNLAPLAAAWLVALLTPANDNLFYKGAVVLGMLLALLAVALRTTEFLPSYAAHAHLVLTYVLYAYAFSSQTSGWPSPYVILLLAIGGAIYYWLYPNLIELWSSVAGYALFIFLATWQALEILIQQPSAWMGRAALAGMLLITVAIVLEAQARFRTFRPAWATASLPIFVLAQLAIAWSVWG